MIVLKRARTHLAETGAYHRSTAPKIQVQGQVLGRDQQNGTVGSDLEHLPADAGLAHLGVQERAANSHRAAIRG